MIRNINMNEISDGKRYTSNDMVKAACLGCGSCCRGMGRSIVLDPLDVQRMKNHLNLSFEQLLATAVELNMADGMILPNIKMDGNAQEKCAFLNEENRCTIHEFRPGICRLFPLGRYYDEDGFKYFMQVNECKNKTSLKVKIKKWIGEDDLKAYENYIVKWHGFVKKVREFLNREINEAYRKQISMWILQEMYMADFYDPETLIMDLCCRIDQLEKKLEG